jgi:hypothetical protein
LEWELYEQLSAQVPTEARQLLDPAERRHYVSLGEVDGEPPREGAINGWLVYRIKEN